jgi:hypothetical protein
LNQQFRLQRPSTPDPGSDEVVRNQIERFFNKLKQFRRIATRYDKLGANFLAFLQLAAVRISLRLIKSTPSLVLRGYAIRATPKTIKLKEIKRLLWPVASREWSNFTYT